MEIKLILFDLDGTLVNTLADLSYSCNCALQKFGLPTHPQEEYRYFVGNGVYKLIERIVPPHERTPEMLARLKAEFDRNYEENYLRESRPYEGIEEQLGLLREKGVKLGVLSNKAHAFTNRMVKTLFAGNDFTCVFGQREGLPTKPNPQAVLEMMEMARVSPRETCFVGDSGVDMLTGVNSGAYPVGVLWGFRESEELLQAGAKALVPTPEQLAEVCLGLSSPGEESPKRLY